MPGSIEATAPSGFTDSGKVLRADFYEVRPSSASGDLSTYLGYFELSDTGSLSFVAAAGSVQPPAQPPVVRSISRSGDATSIVISTESGVKYSLTRLSPAGTSTPVSQWPVVGPEVIGTGADATLTDSSSSDSALYVVRAER